MVRLAEDGAMFKIARFEKQFRVRLGGEILRIACKSSGIAGFRLFWTWKVRRRQPGRPVISREIRALIRQMCRENPGWVHLASTASFDIGEQRQQIHGALPQAAVADLAHLPGQSPHAAGLHRLLHRAHPPFPGPVRVSGSGSWPSSHCSLQCDRDPTTEWTGQQLREAFPFDQLARYLLRDRDAIFGQDFREQARDVGIREVLSTPRSPWQRAYVERVIGSIRRECLDHGVLQEHTDKEFTMN
jgi:putative transposase